MKKTLPMAAITAFIFYPFIIVLLAIIQLFRDKSFRFMGFRLDVNISAHSASATLNIRPFFLLSLLLVFVICMGIFYLFQRFGPHPVDHSLD